MKKIIICSILIIGATFHSTAQTPAFPGCEGWACETQGGRNGQIVFVTNLNDSGVGSLRAAVETNGPRIILFKVSGIIHLQSPIELGHKINMTIAEQRSNVSIFGQSAPGGGIIIADYNFNIANAHDVVLQHLRFRNSIRDTLLASLGDGIEVSGGKRVVIDHCSFSWATDEQISSELRNDVPTDSVTIQNCIFAEGLLNGGHEAGPHSRGAHFSRGVDHIGFHHNFFMSNNKRNASMVGNSDSGAVGPINPIFDFSYNVIYNYGEHATKIDRGAHLNIVGNLYDAGPGTLVNNIEIENFTTGAGTQMYLTGNFSVDDPTATQSDLMNWPGSIGEGLQTSPFATPNITATSIQDLPAYVHCAGALPHDSTDIRLLNEYDNGLGDLGAPNRTHNDPIPQPLAGITPTDSDNDGMPDYWETTNGLNPNDSLDAHADNNSNGYINLEEYLHHISDSLNTCGFILSVTSNEINPFSFNIFPNPANKFLTIQWGSQDNIEVKEVRIYNLQGKTVFTEIINADNEIGEHVIELQNIANGTYLIRLIGNKGSSSKKIIINH